MPKDNQRDGNAKGDETPEDREALANAIRKISKALMNLTRSGLNKDAIVALVQDDSKLPKTTIIRVITSLEDLERRYTR